MKNLNEQIYYVPFCIYVRTTSFNYFDLTVLDQLFLASPLNFLLDTLLGNPQLFFCQSEMQAWSHEEGVPPLSQPVMYRKLYHYPIDVEGVGNIGKYGIGGTPGHQCHGISGFRHHSMEG